MHFDSFSDFIPLIVVALTLWLIRARFSSKVDTNWPLVYYAFLVIFVRYNEGEFDNYWIFAGIVCALFLRYEFIGGAILKAFRSGEFIVHLYVAFRCLLMLTRA